VVGRGQLLGTDDAQHLSWRETLPRIQTSPVPSSHRAPFAYPVKSVPTPAMHSQHPARATPTATTLAVTVFMSS
jgi:hypothetical protein